MNEVDRGVRAYYEDKYDEAVRLSDTPKGRLEMARLRAMLLDELPDGSVVADVGGGPGVHARWLMEAGYAVRLLDPVEAHVKAAAAQGIPAVSGDARELPWGDASFDAVLMFGPLYHLRRPGDRRRALTEAMRVLRPGGHLVVTALNRFAPLIGSAIANNLRERAQEVTDIVDMGYTSRSKNPFVNCAYYHSQEELEAELEGAGGLLVEVRPIGGLGNWPLVVADRHFGDGVVPVTLTEPPVEETALLAAAWTGAHPELTVMSVQFAAFARKEP